jgi:hypothetical protein
VAPAVAGFSFPQKTENDNVAANRNLMARNMMPSTFLTHAVLFLDPEQKQQAASVSF